MNHISPEEVEEARRNRIIGRHIAEEAGIRIKESGWDSSYKQLGEITEFIGYDFAATVAQQAAQMTAQTRGLFLDTMSELGVEIDDEEEEKELDLDDFKDVGDIVLGFAPKHQNIVIDDIRGNGFEYLSFFEHDATIDIFNQCTWEEGNKISRFANHLVEMQGDVDIATIAMDALVPYSPAARTMIMAAMRSTYYPPLNPGERELSRRAQGKGLKEVFEITAPIQAARTPRFGPSDDRFIYDEMAVDVVAMLDAYASPLVVGMIQDTCGLKRLGLIMGVAKVAYAGGADAAEQFALAYSNAGPERREVLEAVIEADIAFSPERLGETTKLAMMLETPDLKQYGVGLSEDNGNN